jgi:hypothetical protein
VELRRATKKQVAALRAAKREESDLKIAPGFYARLVEEAEPFLVVEAVATGPTASHAAGGGPAAGDRAPESTLGYALLLGREHEGHVHTTLVEMGLEPGHRDRYEDVLDLLREHAKPSAYLVRTDDCRLNATLLARGLQVEATALVMVPEESTAPAVAATNGVAGPAEAGTGPLPGAGPQPAAAAGASAPSVLELARLTPAHVPAIAELLLLDGPKAGEPAAHHHGPTGAETLEEVRAMAGAGEGWALLDDGLPQAVIARLAVNEAEYELLDFVVAQGEEAGLAWAFSRATEAVRAAGRRPAAVIDALDPVRRRILRAAGYYTAAAYMVFYDPLAGRPSVPTVSLEDLRAMIARKERFQLVDVMGEEHWKAGHLPGSEWIDFRGLGREARKRYKQDDAIVVYCNGFT